MMSNNKQGSSRASFQPQRPTIALPPRPSTETLFTGGQGASPGPMTLLSTFFPDNSTESPDFRSFSQLLAGAMGSPMAMGSFGPNFTHNSSPKERDGSDREVGFKQSRPLNLVVARSPLFTVPPGLSPSGFLNSPGFFSPQSPFGISHQQALAQVTAQAVLANSHVHTQAQNQSSSLPAPTESFPNNQSFTRDEASQPLTVPSTLDQKTSIIESREPSDSVRKYQPPLRNSNRPSNDGYNWRKYGQKKVRGSEYPRSYYKCTYQNCPVKKKVEHSLEGQITEIIYKGQHNHEPPQHNKHGKDGGESNGNANSQSRPEILSQTQGKNLNESGETVLARSSDTEESGDAEAMEDGDGDEPNPKRRNIDAVTSVVALSHKTLVEPKIVVQTRSEVDLLDDGYRWRKYGQKVVKGNPYPRSYYKCPNPGCNVRKHVERASTDPKAVITTYEGKHNHDVPAARNSSHDTTNSNLPQVKPQKVVAQKHHLSEEMDFGMTRDQQF